MIGPAAVLLYHFRRDQESGARNGTVGTDEHPGEVQEPGFPHEPQAITGTDPVVGKVLGVAVAGKSLIIAGIKYLVHLIDKVGVNDVVGVKDKEAVIAALTDVSLQLMEQIAQCIALALVDGVKPLIDSGAGPAGCARGIIGAVVSYDIDVQQFPGIVLGGQAADELADDFLLISCRDHHRIPVLLLGHKDPGLAQAYQTIHQVDQLIEIGRADGERQHKIKIRNQFQHSTLSNFHSSGQLSRFPDLYSIFTGCHTDYSDPLPQCQTSIFPCFSRKLQVNSGKTRIFPENYPAFRPNSPVKQQPVLCNSQKPALFLCQMYNFYYYVICT